MSVYFMNDNHTFVKLSGLPPHEAKRKVWERVGAQAGYGFIAVKYASEKCSECGRTLPPKEKEPTSINIGPESKESDWLPTLTKWLGEENDG